MTPLQLEPSAHAPWTRTMFIRIYLRDRGNRLGIGRAQLVGRPRGSSSWVSSESSPTGQLSRVRSAVRHRVQTVLHEHTADGTTYQPSSRVTLVKVG